MIDVYMIFSVVFGLILHLLYFSNSNSVLEGEEAEKIEEAKLIKK